MTAAQAVSGGVGDRVRGVRRLLHHAVQVADVIVDLVERRETDVTGVFVIMIVVARAQHDGERHLRLIHRLLPGLRIGLDSLQEALGPVGNEVPAVPGMRKGGDTQRAVAVEIGANMLL